MALLNEQMRLCDILLEEPALIPVVNRFGIRLGVGDKSIAHLCRVHHLDSDFFLSILNTFINESYFPERRLKSFCVAQITNYLAQTNRYYEQFQLPNIERHFQSLLQRSETEENNLAVIQRFFNEFKSDLLLRIKQDNTVLFPAIRTYYTDEKNALSLEDTPIAHLPDRTDLLEEKLTDLLHLFVQHLSGEYDGNLCYGVYFALHSLEKDIRQHNRIRYRILLPLGQSVPELDTNLFYVAR